MKYLKEYNHQFYYEISEDEYLNVNQSLNSVAIEFSDKLIYFFGQIDHTITHRMLFDKSQLTFYTKKGPIDIEALSDEWYLCAFRMVGSSSYYKCDQLEGLLKCIKDNI